MGNSYKIDFSVRKDIHQLLLKGLCPKDISILIGLNYTSILREIQRCEGFYDPVEAEQDCEKKRYKAPIDNSIIGKKFGLLTVENYVNTYQGKSFWKCSCECGGSIIISRSILLTGDKGRKISCGCIPRQSSKTKKVSREDDLKRKYNDIMKKRRINGDCWEYTGYIQQGTPRTSFLNNSISVRKCMYMITHNIFEISKPVYYNCGNKLCFNPDHLTLERPKRKNDN